jgi:hypothetical protein
LLALQIVACFFAAFAVLSIIFGRVGFGLVGIIALALALRPCYSRIAWGTTVRFRDSDMVLLRGQAEICNIPLDTIQNAKIKKKSVSFIYRLDGHLGRKIIGREGFSDSCWDEFTRYFASHVNFAKDA